MLRLLGKWPCLLCLPAVVCPQVEEGAAVGLVSNSSDADQHTIGVQTKIPGLKLFGDQ